MVPKGTADGSILYHTYSLINHSCYSNTRSDIQSGDGGFAIKVYAQRPIASGEEVIMSTIPLWTQVMSIVPMALLLNKSKSSTDHEQVHPSPEVSAAEARSALGLVEVRLRLREVLRPHRARHQLQGGISIDTFLVVQALFQAFLALFQALLGLLILLSCHFSSLRCRECPDGFLTPLAPRALGMPWGCGDCGARLGHESVVKLLQVAWAILVSVM